MDFIPNQKVIKINREKVIKGLTGGRLFLVAYQDNISAAMKTLSHTAFKIYIYLLFQKDGYSVCYSPEYLHKAANMCKDTARKGINELIEKGYIDKTERGYDFYEYPRRRRVIKPIGEKKEFVDDETGEIYVYTYNQLVAAVGEEQAAALWEVNSDVEK